MTTIDATDVDAINRAATEEFGDWGPEVLVTQEMIDGFAELTGDRQWIHIDVERCKQESPFGGPIAHGFLTLSLLPRVTPPASYTLGGVKNALNYGSEGFRFLAPVPVDSILHARSRLVGAEKHRAGTLVTTETATHVLGNNKPSLLYTGKVLYQD